MPLPYDNILTDDINTLNGVGTKLALTLKKLNIIKKIDLLFHFPINITTIYYKELTKEIIFHHTTSIPLTIKTYIYKKGKSPFQVIAEDYAKNRVYINFFNYYSTAYLKKLLPLNSIKIICGKFEKFGNRIIVNHPQVFNNNTHSKSTTYIRTYKIVTGITNNRLKDLISTILKETVNLPEWFDKDFIKFLQLPTFIEAIKNIHLNKPHPNNNFDKSYLRLALDEMLAFQLKLIKAQQFNIKKTGYIFRDTNKLIKKLYNNLPFKLTTSQIFSIKEIFTDLKGNKQMVRLLEGDVGSGKTIVALFSTVLAVSSGYNVVFMVPTESLAKQHLDTFKQYSKILNINVALLTGSTNTKERKTILKNLENNTINVLIGTHAIFQPDVIFNNLGLIIIDEQHRFGVNQRLSLIKKNINPHILMLSATPIPRTLALTTYGHISISRLTHKPANRKPIVTKALPNKKIDKVLERIQKIVLESEKAFWICPFIEESKHLNFTPTINRYKSLLNLLPKDCVWLLHGKMSSQEKENILLSFRNAKKGILVTTTMVEVGIDIPDANIIVIEHAERFGLAQLHQLRGRVGRGNNNAYCLLLYNPQTTINSTKRMEIMETSNDGFYIAEKDYELRGAGNILGTQQSGVTPFKIATLEVQRQYMNKIVTYAHKLYLNNPQKYLLYNSILDKIFHFNLEEFNFIDAFNNG